MTRHIRISAFAVAALLAALAPVAYAAPTDHGKILFDNDAGSSQDVYAVNPDGDGVVDLTPDTPLSNEIQPTWSPDGTMIAFVSDRGGSPQVYVMPAAGGTPHLVPNTTNARQPAFSPDANRIVFMAVDGGVSQLRIVNVDGSGTPVNLTAYDPKGWSGLTCCAFNPRFSPDGRHIAYTRANVDDATCAGGQRPCLSVHTMRTDTSDDLQLTADDLDAARPDWSPDGTTIAFMTHWYEPNSDIDTVSAGGGGVRALITGKDDEIFPRWSPNGRQIAFTDIHRGCPCDIFTAEVDNPRARTRVTRLDGFSGVTDWATT